MSKSVEREEFEKWAEIHGYSISRQADDYYVFISTADAWEAWQARGAALSIQQEADAKDAAMFRKLEKIMGRGEYMPGRDVHRAVEVLVDPNPNKPMPTDCSFKIIRHYQWKIRGTNPDIRECLSTAMATPTGEEEK